MNKLILSLCLTAMLCSCAADSYQRVPTPKQEVEVSSPAVSRIYIVRLPQGKGMARGMSATESGKEIGRMGRGHYLCWERAPGRSLVIVSFERKEAYTEDPETMIDVNAEAGHAYYYGITVDEGWERAVVRLMSRDEALKVMKDQSPAPQG